MIAAPAKLTIADNTDSVVIRPVPLDYTAPVVTREWSPGAPEVREATAPLTGLDGTDDGSAYTGARTVTLDLIIRGDSGVSAYEYAERLAAFTHPGRRPYLYIERAGVTTDGPWRMLLRGTPFSLSYGKRAAAMLELQLAFVAPLGYWESPQREQASPGPSVAVTPLSYPITYPINFGTGGTSPAIPLTVTGSVPAPPSIAIYGPATNPELLTDTGELMAFTPLSLASGQYAHVDMASGAITLNGDPTASIYHLVDWTRSRYWRLWPGSRQLTITGQTGQVIVRWRDRRFTI